MFHKRLKRTLKAELCYHLDPDLVQVGCFKCLQEIKGFLQELDLKELLSNKGGKKRNCVKEKFYTRVKANLLRLVLCCND